jgi:hypothetical protein
MVMAKKSFIYATGTSSVIQDACQTSRVTNHARRCDLLIPWEDLEFGLSPGEYKAIVTERFG